MQLCLLGLGREEGGDKRGFFSEMAFPVLRGMLEQCRASGMFASLETLPCWGVAKKLGHAIPKKLRPQPLSARAGQPSRREVNAWPVRLKTGGACREASLP